MQKKLVENFKPGQKLTYKGQNMNSNFEAKTPSKTSKADLKMDVAGSKLSDKLRNRLRSLDTGANTTKAEVSIQEQEVAQKSENVIIELTSSTINLHQFEDESRVASKIVELNIREMANKTKLEYTSLKTPVTLKMPMAFVITKA